MTIKELKEAIVELPEDAEICINSDYELNIAEINIGPDSIAWITLE